MSSRQTWGNDWDSGDHDCGSNWGYDWSNSEWRYNWDSNWGYNSSSDWGCNWNSDWEYNWDTDRGYDCDERWGYDWSSDWGKDNYAYSGDWASSVSYNRGLSERVESTSHSDCDNTKITETEDAGTSHEESSAGSGTEPLSNDDMETPQVTQYVVFVKYFFLLQEDGSFPVEDARWLKWDATVWQFRGFLCLDADGEYSSLKEIPKLVDQVSAQFGDDTGGMFRFLNSRGARKGRCDWDAFWNLTCSQHIPCSVQLRLILEPGSPHHKQRVRIYRNRECHGDIAREDSKEAKYVKFPPKVRMAMLKCIEVNPSTTATMLYNKFFLKDCGGAVPESADAINQRKRVKEAISNLKRSYAKSLRKQCLETVGAFIKDLEPFKWDLLEWDKAMSALDAGSHLRPSIISLDHYVDKSAFAVPVSSTLCLQSAYFLQRCAGETQGITLYCDGQQSSIRGCAAQLFFVGASRVEYDDVKQDYQTSMVPLILAIVSEETFQAIRAVFEAVKSLLQKAAPDGIDVRVTCVCSDAGPGIVKAVRASFPSAFSHRCRYHREENVKTKSGLSKLEREQALLISRLLAAAPDDEAYEGLLRALTEDSAVSNKASAYFNASSRRDVFGDPRLPTIVDQRLTIVTADNNLSESFNASTQRSHQAGQKAQRRFNSGPEVMSFVRSVLLGLDVLKRGVFLADNALRVAVAIGDADKAATRPSSHVYVYPTRKEFLVASSDRGSSELTEADAAAWERRDYATVRDWAWNVMTIYRVHFEARFANYESMSPYVCSCPRYGQYGTCYHVHMVISRLSDQASSEPSHQLPNVQPPPREMSGTAGIVINGSGQESAFDVLIADGSKRKRGRPTHKPPALKRAKTDVTPLLPTRSVAEAFRTNQSGGSSSSASVTDPAVGSHLDLPPGVGATLSKTV